MHKLTVRIADGVDHTAALAFLRVLHGKVDAAPFRPKSDFPVLMEWGALQAVYRYTKAGNHSFLIELKP